MNNKEYTISTKYVSFTGETLSDTVTAKASNPITAKRAFYEAIEGIIHDMADAFYLDPETVMQDPDGDCYSWILLPDSFTLKTTDMDMSLQGTATVSLNINY